MSLFKIHTVHLFITQVQLTLASSNRLIAHTVLFWVHSGHHQKDRLCGQRLQLLTCYIEHLLGHACLWGGGSWRGLGLFSTVCQAVSKTEGPEQPHRNLFFTDSIKVIQQNVQDILRNTSFAHLIYNPVLTVTQLFDHFYICHKCWDCVMRESCY